MRLSDLGPSWGVVNDRNLTPENHMGGDPTDMFWLRFICPACGPPYIIAITVGLEVRDHAAGTDGRCWKATPMPDGVDWPSRVTIEPSIDFTHAGHGRRHPTCSFHGTIINGEVHLS